MTTPDRYREFFASPAADAGFFWVVFAWSVIGIGYAVSQIAKWWWCDKVPPVMCEFCNDVVQAEGVIVARDFGEPLIYCSSSCGDEDGARSDQANYARFHQG